MGTFTFSWKKYLTTLQIHPFRALSGVIFDTEQDEDKSDFIFSSMIWGLMTELQIPLHFIFPVLSMHMLLPF